MNTEYEAVPPSARPRHPRGCRGRRIEASVLRQREHEQRASLARPQHAGEEAFGPGAPARRHGDVLPTVDAVAGRARVVPAAALELPQQLTGLGVERVELPGRLAAEHEAAAR